MGQVKRQHDSSKIKSIFKHIYWYEKLRLYKNSQSMKERFWCSYYTFHKLNIFNGCDWVLFSERCLLQKTDDGWVDSTEGDDGRVEGLPYFSKKEEEEDEEEEEVKEIFSLFLCMKPSQPLNETSFWSFHFTTLLYFLPYVPTVTYSHRTSWPILCFSVTWLKVDINGVLIYLL